MARPNKLGIPEKGTAGAFTYFTKDGVPLMRVSYANTTDRKPSDKEMENRLLVINPSKLWHKFRGEDKPSFEDCKPLQSDFSRFFSVNRKSNERVYLTKQMVEAGACVLTHATVSAGSLPRIEQTREGEKFVSDISVGSIKISPTTTVAQLSAAIINSNLSGRFVETDVIACFIGRQSLDSSTGYPMVAIESNRLYLDAGDTTPLSEVLNPGVGFEVSDGGFLAFTAPQLTLGTYVQTRRAPNGEQAHDMASPQDFLGDNPLIATFGTAAAKKAASDSYGGTRKTKYLRPQCTVKLIRVVPATGGTGGDGGNQGNTDPTQVELTFAVNNSAWGSVTPESGLYTVGSTIQAVATPKSGCEFTGWSDSVTTATRTITVPATAQTYTANFRTGGGLGVWLEQHPDATPEEIAEEMRRLKEANSE